MSTPHAIAAVTKALVNLLDEGLKAAQVADVLGGAVTVTALSPKRVDVGGANDPDQLNLFLYQALPNHGGTGFDLPTRDSGGARVRNTPLALDLCYLVTAYGSAAFLAEVILGHAMHVLHENPVLGRDGLRRWLTPSAAPSNLERALAEAGLPEQVEALKVSPERLTSEELARLWSALGADYRPTSAYRVTVVLVEGTASTKRGLPVRERAVHLATLSNPRIERVLSRALASGPALEGAPILSGHHLVLVGRNLAAERTRVLVDGLEQDPREVFLSSDAIGFRLPATLRAGGHGVQVVHAVAAGSPPVPHTFAASNAVSFLLQPTLTAVHATASALTVHVQPAVTPVQAVTVVLNELGGGRAYTFRAPQGNGIDGASGQTESSAVAVPYGGAVAGTYLVRVQVDGAESALTAGPDGAYTGPTVVLP